MKIIKTSDLRQNLQDTIDSVFYTGEPALVMKRNKPKVIITPLPKEDIKVEKAIKEEGLLAIINEAGFELREPGCSACLAMNDDKVPPGKLAVSTSNRNFEGRQGPGSRTLLASPLVAAAAAVTGKVTDPRELMQKEMA